MFLHILFLVVLKLAKNSCKLFVELLLASFLLALKASDHVFQVVNRAGEQFGVLIAGSLDLVELLAECLSLLELGLIALIIGWGDHWGIGVASLWGCLWFSNGCSRLLT